MGARCRQLSWADRRGTTLRGAGRDSRITLTAIAFMKLQSHGKFWAIMHLRCPRCHHGRVYASLLKMNPECPVCHLKFEREPGYFSGAVFFSFLICAAVTVIWFIVLWLLFPLWND